MLEAIPEILPTEGTNKGKITITRLHGYNSYNGKHGYHSDDNHLTNAKAGVRVASTEESDKHFRISYIMFTARVIPRCTSFTHNLSA